MQARADGKVVFTASDGVSGLELWESDGTAVGTRMFQDLNPGVGSSNPAGFILLGPRLFFIADDGAVSFEPWVLSVADL